MIRRPLSRFEEMPEIRVMFEGKLVPIKRTSLHGLSDAEMKIAQLKFLCKSKIYYVGDVKNVSSKEYYYYISE